MNYKCSFPKEWLGLEKEELVKATGLSSAIFCHKGGFIMTVDDPDDAVAACKKALDEYEENSVIVRYGATEEIDEMLTDAAAAIGIKGVRIVGIELMKIPEMNIISEEKNQIYAEIAMEKTEWKSYVKEKVKEILKYKPEAVYVTGNTLQTYPVARAIRKKHIPVLTDIKKDGRTVIVKIP